MRTDDLLTGEVLAEIYEHSVRSHPAEACGFVRAGGVKRCANVADQLSGERPDHFTRTATTGYAFGVADLRELAESFGTDDPVRIIYHSHPDVGAYFSDEDARHAVFEGMPVYPVRHLVVDATADGARGARLFGFSAEQGRYVEVAVYGEPKDRTPNRTGSPS